MALKNSELRTMLITKLETLSAKESQLSLALAKLTPQTLTLDDRKILNELGMTVPSDPAPDNPQINQIEAALDTIAYHLAQLKATLEELPSDNKTAVVSISDVMAWDMVGDPVFAGI